MCDSGKTKTALIEELQTLRSRAAELERIEAEHKKVEQKLKQYQFMVESAHDVIFFKDLKSRYVIANDKTLEAFGLSREQVIGKNDYEIMPKRTEAGKNIEDDKLVFKTGKPTEITKHMTGSDGKERWFQAIKVPQFDDEGKIIGLIGIARDITALKRAEETQRESQHWQRAILDSIPDIAWLKDKKSRYIAANEPLCKAFGIKLEDLVGRTDFDISPEDLAKRYRVDDKEVMKSGKRKRIEEPWEDKDSKRIWIETIKTPICNDKGEVIGTSGIARDITEHKKAEEELLFKSTLLEAQSETSIDGILVVDSEGKSISFNKNFGRMWNIPQQILDTRDDEKMLQYVLSQLKDPEQFLERVKYLYAHKNEKSRDEIQFKDGRVFDRYSSPLLDSNDKYCGRVWYFRDVTERKHAEDELQQARDELEIRVEQRTADLESVNEELRSEITERKKAEEKLLIYQKQLRSLASELSLAEERLRRRIATNVHDHVGQNLAISKIKIESLRESATSPELAEDLEEIRDLISQTIESTRSLTFELSPPVLYELGFEAAVEWLVRQTRQQHGVSTEFKGDGKTKPLDNNVRILLFQAVRELLVNVAKHAQAHNVTVSTRRVGNEIRVSVEDDGVGFDISQTGSYDHKTGGFGLFSIRERLGHIGGRLEVESRPGLGTRVTLTAPIDQDSQNSKEQRK